MLVSIENFDRKIVFSSSQSFLAPIFIFWYKNRLLQKNSFSYQLFHKKIAFD